MVYFLFRPIRVDFWNVSSCRLCVLLTMFCHERLFPAKTVNVWCFELCCVFAVEARQTLWVIIMQTSGHSVKANFWFPEVAFDGTSIGDTSRFGRCSCGCNDDKRLDTITRNTQCSCFGCHIDLSKCKRRTQDFSSQDAHPQKNRWCYVTPPSPEHLHGPMGPIS